METPLSSKIQEKVQLLNKRVQDKKTQEVFIDENQLTYDEIADILEVSDVQENRLSENYNPHMDNEEQQTSRDIIVSILATMKSIAHTVQSKVRWEKFLNDHSAKGEEVFTLSSHGDFTEIGGIIKKIGGKNPPRHIVMCTHIKRMEDLTELVDYLEDSNDNRKRPIKIRIYLDEFDKYIDRMRDTVEKVVLSNAVSKITLVTATPRNLWSSKLGWEKLYILNPRIEGDSESYLMFKDCKHFNTDDFVTPKENLIRDWMEIEGRSNIELINHHHKVALKFPDIYTPGRVIFAPGNVSRISHEYVRQFWNGGFKCAVAIINGERTKDGFYGTLYIDTNEAIDIPHMSYKDFKSEEMKQYILSQPDGALDEGKAQLNDIIADLYKTYNLDKVPFIITGRLCVERAQTLVHPVWGSFTDAIYFRALSPDDGYQQQRQLGHIKKWDSYRGIPRVFSPEQFRKDVLQLESRADNFASKYANSYATIKDYISAGGNELTSAEKKAKNREERNEIRSKIIEHPTVFKTIEDVNKFLKEKLGVKRGINRFETHGGFEITHRLNSLYKKKKNTLAAEDRLTKEKYNRDIKKALNIASWDKKGQHYMVYPVYPTMMSSPRDVEYYVCYLPKEDTITHV